MIGFSPMTPPVLQQTIWVVTDNPWAAHVTMSKIPCYGAEQGAREISP